MADDLIPTRREEIALSHAEVLKMETSIIVKMSDVSILMQKVRVYEDTLGKIADPRKRDHREPDHYTQLGCVMHMAEEALDAGKRIEVETKASFKGSSDELANKSSEVRGGEQGAPSELPGDRRSSTEG